MIEDSIGMKDDTISLPQDTLVSKNNMVSVENKGNLIKENRDFGKEATFKDFKQQIIASCIAHCVTIQAGVNMVYGTVLVEDLKTSTDENLRADDNEISWITSVVTIALPLGSLIVGPTMDKFGRKNVCLMSCGTILLSWILLLFAKSLTVIYLARIISGASAGLTTIVLVYITEITHLQIRPVLLCLNSVSVCLGILITCFLAIWLNWHEITFFFIILYVCIFGMLLLIPESPYWLAYFGKDISKQQTTLKINRVLKWLYRDERMYEQECVRMMGNYDNFLSRDESSNTNIIGLIRNYRQQLIMPQVYKPITILFILLLFQQLSGTYVVIFYAQSVFGDILKNITDTSSQKIALALMGFIRFFMSILTVFLSKKCGRRVLCMTSGLGMAISMICASAYAYATISFHDENLRGQIKNQSWLFTTFILAFVCTSSLGFAIIPWTMIGELLPTSFRGAGSGLMVSIAYIMMFIVLKNYPFAMNSIGAPGIFGFFSLMSLMGTGFVYFFLPETLGKPLADIENRFTETQ